MPLITGATLNLLLPRINHMLSLLYAFLSVTAALVVAVSDRAAAIQHPTRKLLTFISETWNYSSF